MRNYGDWTKENVLKIVRSKKSSNRDVVVLDMEHTTRVNEIDVLSWLEESGYEAKLDGERIVVKLS